MYRWLVVLLALAGTAAAQQPPEKQQPEKQQPEKQQPEKQEPAKMHMMRPDDMLYCHLVAQQALKSEQVGLMSKEDYEAVSRLARTAKGVQVLDQVHDATFRGLADYVGSDIWNSANLKNQEAIAATDNRDVVARERFLTGCLINIANLGMGTAEAYRRKLLYGK